jgi:molecular chaperone GrpE
MTQPSPRPSGHGTEVTDATPDAETESVSDVRDGSGAPDAPHPADAPAAPGSPASAGARPDGGSGGEGPADQQGPVVRDKRRLDPQTGQVRAAYAATEPRAEDAAQQPVDHVSVDQVPTSATGAASASGAGAVDSELAAARSLADERLDDLQRLQAEYVNYRRRVERDRDVARDLAVASVLEALLPVLDDVHLARQHGDLEGGPFAAIAEKLEATLGRFGLMRYGEPGETFDPTVHEALMHTQAELAEGTTDTTVVQILQPGYRAGERVLRAARVAVADPQ